MARRLAVPLTAGADTAPVAERRMLAEADLHRRRRSEYAGPRRRSPTPPAQGILARPTEGVERDGILTIVNEWIAQGEAKGEAKGRVEAHYDVAEILTDRFGPLPPDLEARSEPQLPRTDLRLGRWPPPRSPRSTSSAGSWSYPDPSPPAPRRSAQSSPMTRNLLAVTGLVLGLAGVGVFLAVGVWVWNLKAEVNRQTEYVVAVRTPPGTPPTTPSSSSARSSMRHDKDLERPARGSLPPMRPRSRSTRSSG